MAIITMGILGNGLFGAGMRLVQEREQNILRRFKVTPISPAPLLVAQLCELISCDRDPGAGTFGPTGMTGTPMIDVKVVREWL